MKNKAKNIVFYLGIAVIGLIVGYTLWMPNGEVDTNSKLAIMLEQDDGSYQMGNGNSLVPEGYTFNSEKSSCVNGSVISWNGDNASIDVLGNDVCTLYFDKIHADFAIKSITVNGTPSQTIPTSTTYTVTPSCTGATASWNYATWSLDVSSVTSASASCSLAFTSKSSPNYLNNYIKGKVGSTQGESSDKGQIVNENGYRYEGSDPYNYVLFNNELWRIIGVFDTTLSNGSTVQSLTKIIRSESIGSYAFSSSNTNYWVNTSGTRSSLNILLNDYYYKGLDGTNSGSCLFYSSTVTGNCNWTVTGINDNYRRMIENVTWNLGAIGTIGTADTAYTNERGTTTYSGNATTSTGYIGLMYPSDYGYSVLASSCARTTSLGSYSTAACAGKAWMLKNGHEWTIAPNSSSSTYVWGVFRSGLVDSSAYLSYAARPVLYLKSDVYIVSGDGSQNNPYIING